MFFCEYGTVAFVSPGPLHTIRSVAYPFPPHSYSFGVKKRESSVFVHLALVFKGSNKNMQQLWADRRDKSLGKDSGKETV